jgi:hypothetical protein
MGDLAGVSAQLAGEREELQGALAALARAVGTVRTFVHDNKGMVTSEIGELTTVLSAVAKEQHALGTAVQLAPLGLGNLTTAFDVKTGTIGSRVQFGDTCEPFIPCVPTAVTLGNVLCDVVVNSGTSSAQQICQLLSAITSKLDVNLGRTPSQSGRTSGAPQVTATEPESSLSGLLGGLSGGGGR